MCILYQWFQTETTYICMQNIYITYTFRDKITPTYNEIS